MNLACFKNLESSLLKMPPLVLALAAHVLQLDTQISMAPVQVWHKFKKHPIKKKQKTPLVNANFTLSICSLHDFRIMTLNLLLVKTSLQM